LIGDRRPLIGDRHQLIGDRRQGTANPTMTGDPVRLPDGPVRRDQTSGTALAIFGVNLSADRVGARRTSAKSGRICRTGPRRTNWTSRFAATCAD
ncbi:MAG: hypothetical protein ABJD68_16295, partial [Nakamurella sp.]